MTKRKLNKRQVDTLKNLICRHMHEILINEVEANKTFEKIKKYGVKTMPEAVALYKESKA